jgi:DNA invertase Pin-like site-specific DNA recombinase
MVISQKRLFAYYRVSTEMQEYESQVKAVKDWVNELGDVTIVKAFKEPAKSGSDNSRPRFLQMIARLSDVDGVIVWDWDRLTRDWEMSNTLAFLFGRENKLLYVVKTREVMNLADNFQKLVVNIKGFVASQELDKIRANIRRGIANYKAKHGHWGRHALDLNWREYEKYVRKGVPKRAIARIFKVSPTVLYGRVKLRFLELLQNGVPEIEATVRLGLTRDLATKYKVRRLEI